MHHRDASTTTSADRRSLLDLFRSGGDAHVGQTLVRLAALAEAAHAGEQAQRVATGTPLSTEVHGWASGRLVSAFPGEGGSARKDSHR